MDIVDIQLFYSCFGAFRGPEDKAFSAKTQGVCSGQAVRKHFPDAPCRYYVVLHVQCYGLG